MSKLTDALKTAFEYGETTRDLVVVAPWFYDYMCLSERWGRKTGKIGGMSYRRFKAFAKRKLGE
jgi:hypothetical protein